MDALIKSRCDFFKMAIGMSGKKDGIAPRKKLVEFTFRSIHSP